MSEWKPYTIDELKADHKTSIAIGPFGSRMKSDCYVDSGIPVIRGNNISDLPGFFGEFVYISEEKAKEVESSRVHKNDLVFPHRGNIGEVGIITGHQSDEYVMSTSLMKLTCNSEIVEPWFIYYFFKSKVGKRKLLQNASQVGTPGIATPLTSLKSIEVLLPSIDEQKQIVNVLLNLDRKIENLRRQNETLEAISQTLFKHWFVDFEFPFDPSASSGQRFAQGRPNADGKPYKSSGGEMVPSAIGEIPAGWNVDTLGNVVKVNAESIGKSYPHKEIEYVDISSVGIGVLEGTTSYPLKKAPSRARRLVKHGDVIWSGVRPNRKSYLFIAHPPENLVVSTGFITLTPDLIPSSYLYSWVTTDAFVEYLTFNASGSAYPAVKAEHFEIAEVLLPDKFNLSKFHALVDPMREKIHQNSRQIQTLTKTRDVLLPKLMSGKLRIQEELHE